MYTANSNDVTSFLKQKNIKKCNTNKNMKGIKKIFKKEKMNFTSLNIEDGSAVTTHQAPVLDVRQSEEFDTDGPLS